MYGKPCARRAVELGFNLVDQTKIVTASSELGRNTLDYGGGGQAHVEVVENGARTGLRVIFEDQGPGIPDINLALKDGYTSGSGMGLGLGGAKASIPRVRNSIGCRAGNADQSSCDGKVFKH